MAEEISQVISLGIALGGSVPVPIWSLQFQIAVQIGKVPNPLSTTLPVLTDDAVLTPLFLYSRLRNNQQRTELVPLSDIWSWHFNSQCKR